MSPSVLSHNSQCLSWETSQVLFYSNQLTAQYQVNTRHILVLCSHNPHACAGHSFNTSNLCCLTGCTDQLNKPPHQIRWPGLLLPFYSLSVHMLVSVDRPFIHVIIIHQAIFVIIKVRHQVVIFLSELKIIDVQSANQWSCCLNSITNWQAWERCLRDGGAEVQYERQAQHAGIHAILSLRAATTCHTDRVGVDTAPHILTIISKRVGSEGAKQTTSTNGTQGNLYVLTQYSWQAKQSSPAKPRTRPHRAW